MRPDEYVHSSLYANHMYAAIILGTSILMIFLSTVQQTPNFITLSLALACIPPSIAVYILSDWINMDLRMALKLKDRSREELWNDINKINIREYNYGEEKGEKISEVIKSNMYFICIINRLSAVSLSLSIGIFLLRLGIWALPVLISFGPLIYAIKYTLEDWGRNGETHVNWSIRK